MSFLRHRKIYQSDALKRELNCSLSSLPDHRSDESSTGYSFMSCSPAELMSASPAPNSISLNPAAVKRAAANHNRPSFSLSQPKGPYQDVPEFFEWDFVKFLSSFGLSGLTDVDLDQLPFGEAERGAKQVVGQVFHASKVTPETVGTSKRGEEDQNIAMVKRFYLFQVTR